jgi:ABC-type Fe3+/spermidine/putrescine transport system ATPase subunit
MSTVRLDHVTKQYGTTVAVRELDLEVADGEFLTLLGPSGCGKTTTLRMIAGLIEPSGGRIHFDDEDVTYVPPRSRNIGFVFQTPALFPHLSVAKNIAFGLSVKGAKKDAIDTRVEEMLALVGLAGYGERMPAQLSGGQQQRVALARVLATDPRVLLFDEPLSALDRNLRDSLKYSILDLQRKTGKTAIYVTHDQSEAFAISDRIVVMNAGQAEQIGTQTEIYLHPETPFVAQFIGATNGLSGTIAGIEPGGGADGGDEGIARVSVGGMEIRSPARPDLATGDPVLVYIRPEDLVVIHDGEDGRFANVVEGDVQRVIFEGPTAQLRVAVDGRELRADVSGGERLTFIEGRGRVRLGFNDVTLIPDPGRAAVAAAAAAAGSPADETAETTSGR